MLTSVAPGSLRNPLISSRSPSSSPAAAQVNRTKPCPIQADRAHRASHRPVPYRTLAMPPPATYTRYETRRRDPDPRAAALLVIDVQGHFASLVAPAMPAIASTVELCRAAGVPVIYTRHVDPVPRSRPLGEWWPGDRIDAGTPAAELLPGAGRAPGDLVVEKSTYSAFAGTALEEALRGMGAEEVIVAGVMTNLCCETTARDAFVRGFRVFFSADATATASRDLQEATLANMAYGFAYIADCKRLEAALGKAE
ncbi:nicotinamidase 2-like [Phragmites australis]|uniref:nicotinamidase 2-like n=1 Tax=Phragmites australis TaxID=29695 RepID=UPI002D797062|nr:nicotinamidase 2-like [Phragmites australis]XP_062184191.1 nicotinamidase 2-like [Phragmites australis]XP_062184192.1 nicotinamidase 2-like [Phragmites australis]